MTTNRSHPASFAGLASRPARRTLVASLLGGLALAALLPAPAQAQIRPIPASARLGTLTLGYFPDAVLDGKAVKLGPGTRIRDINNLFIVPSTIQGQRRTVAYTTGNVGEIDDVWILSDAEIAQIRSRQSGRSSSR